MYPARLWVDLLGQGIPDGQDEIWLYDTATMTYTRITWANDASRDSWTPRLSADGTKVTFYSDADLLGQGIADEQYEVWVYDVAQAALERITWASEVDRDSRLPALSADGEVLAFHSDSDILAQMIDDDQHEIWTYHVERAFLPAVLRSYP